MTRELEFGHACKAMASIMCADNSLVESTIREYFGNPDMIGEAEWEEFTRRQFIRHGESVHPPKWGRIVEWYENDQLERMRAGKIKQASQMCEIIIRNYVFNADSATDEIYKRLNMSQEDHCRAREEVEKVKTRCVVIQAFCRETSSYSALRDFDPEDRKLWNNLDSHRLINPDTGEIE